MAANPSLDKSPNLDDWLSIDREGQIRIRTGKIDIGQRISTALAMIAAEELDVAYDRIEIMRVDTSSAPNEAITSGSNSMQQSGNAVRLAAATARQHLLGLAAAALNVDAASLEITDGLIRSRATNRARTYGELLDGKPFGIAVDLAAKTKSPESYAIVGQPRTARGMADLVTGKARFIHDMTMPDMVHARVVRPPHSQARLRGLDAAAVAKLDADGVKTVRDGSFLAVAGRDEFTVIKAIERLNRAADWDGRDGLDAGNIYTALRDNARVSLPVIEGTPIAAPVPPRPDSVTLGARYERPYHMHGSIGPSAAMAHLTDGKLTLWTHSQGIYVLRQSMAEALDMETGDIHIHHAPGSGCYVAITVPTTPPLTPP
jgi:CO/xanthine dehydrogenase Mo-binding subunit